MWLELITIVRVSWHNLIGNKNLKEIADKNFVKKKLAIEFVSFAGLMQTNIIINLMEIMNQESHLVSTILY